MHSDGGGVAIGARSGQLVSAATLAHFTTSVIRLTRRAAPTSRALPATALIGGISAVASLTASGLYAAALTTARSDSEIGRAHV